MAPIINNISENQFGELTLTMTNVNVSIANAIRRTLLSDIPLLVFRTFPHDKNKVEFLTNTTRFNNEILKQRISAVPVYIKDVDEFPTNDYEFIINKSNQTANIEFVTSEDFTIKDTKNSRILDKSQAAAIFPKNNLTNSYIDIVRLRPKISENMQGEELKIVGKLDVGTSKEDSNFNAVSTATYAFTPDPVKINEIWETKVLPEITSTHSKEEINKYKKNWNLLEAKRYYKENSFDFKIKSVCVFSNKELLEKSCAILIKQLVAYSVIIKSGKIKINKGENTLDNSYDIVMENMGYTIGKIIEHYMFKTYFQESDTLSFCGFNKEHPHYKDSILRIAFKLETNDEIILSYLIDSCYLAINEINEIMKQFQ
jgi:DNA-directed RNA polymerase subunit L/predicted lipoprotein